MEYNEGAPFAAYALGYGEEVNQAGLAEALRHVENDAVILDGVTLEYFLYTDSCVAATKGVTDGSIV